MVSTKHIPTWRRASATAARTSEQTRQATPVAPLLSPETRPLPPTNQDASVNKAHALTAVVATIKAAYDKLKSFMMKYRKRFTTADEVMAMQNEDVDAAVPAFYIEKVAMQNEDVDAAVPAFYIEKLAMQNEDVDAAVPAFYIEKVAMQNEDVDAAVPAFYVQKSMVPEDSLSLSGSRRVTSRARSFEGSTSCQTSVNPKPYRRAYSDVQPRVNSHRNAPRTIDKAPEWRTHSMSPTLRRENAEYQRRLAAVKPRVYQHLTVPANESRLKPRTIITCDLLQRPAWRL